VLQCLEICRRIVVIVKVDDHAETPDRSLVIELPYWYSLVSKISFTPRL
jgi:hypothetical protein